MTALYSCHASQSGNSSADSLDFLLATRTTHPTSTATVSRSKIDVPMPFLAQRPAREARQ